jgi:hypothetical protein
LEKVIFDNTPIENGHKAELNKELILENKAMIEAILKKEK